MAKQKKIKRKYTEDVKRELYMKSGGRCYRCNKLLYEEELGSTKGNFSQKAHIRSISQDGPDRPDPENIIPLEKINSTENLVLLCGVCHKIVDFNKVKEYPLEAFLTMKKEHELRVRSLTGIKPENYTAVLSFIINTSSSSFGGNPPQEEILQAVLPKYPKLDSSENILFNHSIQKTKDDSTYYLSMSNEIETLVNQRITPLLQKGTQISIFAMAPIPLLIELGLKIGNGNNIKIYEGPRSGKNNWKWNIGESDITFKLECLHDFSMGEHVGIIINTSYKNDRSSIPKSVPHMSLYEIFYEGEISPDRISKYSDLENFQINFEAFLSKIVNYHPNLKTLHLFPATSCPVSISVGLLIKQKPLQSIVIYDKQNTSFIKALESVRK